MDEHEWLAKRFEANRTHLRAVAYRILGSRSDHTDRSALKKADPLSLCLSLCARGLQSLCLGGKL